MSNEQQFVSLDLPDDNGLSTMSGNKMQTGVAGGGLEFLTSNYDYNNPKSSDNSGDSSTIHFGEMSISIQYFRKKNFFDHQNLNLIIN
jgi:hypothetical protein